MQQQLPKIANVFLVILGYRRSAKPKTQLLCLYCMSILVLTIYSISVYAAFSWFQQAELESVTKWSGLFSSLTVIMLDMEVRAPALCHLTCGTGRARRRFSPQRRSFCTRTLDWQARRPSRRCCSCSAVVSRLS